MANIAVGLRSDQLIDAVGTPINASTSAIHWQPRAGSDRRNVRADLCGWPAGVSAGSELVKRVSP